MPPIKKFWLRKYAKFETLIERVETVLSDDWTAPISQRALMEKSDRFS